MMFERFMRAFSLANAICCMVGLAHCVATDDLTWGLLNAICVPLNVSGFTFYDRQIERSRSRP